MKKQGIKLLTLATIVVALFASSCHKWSTYRGFSDYTNYYQLHNDTKKDMTLYLRLDYSWRHGDTGIVYDTIFLGKEKYINLFVCGKSLGECDYKPKSISSAYTAMPDSMLVVIDNIVVKRYGTETGKRTPLIGSYYEKTKELSGTESEYTYTFLPEDFE